MRRLEQSVGQPELETIRKIAAYYDVRLDELLGRPMATPKAEAPDITGRNVFFRRRFDPNEPLPERWAEVIREIGPTPGALYTNTPPGFSCVKPYAVRTFVR